MPFVPQDFYGSLTHQRQDDPAETLSMTKALDKALDAVVKLAPQDNETKHTPGPWHADIHGHIMAMRGTTNVASTWTTSDKNYPEGRPYRANAKLIAAAPDMLNALKVVLASRRLEEWDTATAVVLAAIEKATAV
jgi:hypothetical protein